MNGEMSQGFRRAVTGAAVAVAMIGAGVAAEASAAPAPDDANCMVEPYLATCQGGPFGIPTSSSDPQCAMSPADAVCAGGPFAPPAMPPPIGSDLPGSLMPNGMPYGSAPIDTGMPGSIPGMPGSI